MSSDDLFGSNGSVSPEDVGWHTNDFTGGVSLRPRQLSMSPTKRYASISIYNLAQRCLTSTSRFSPPSSPESQDGSDTNPATSKYEYIYLVCGALH
jgi:hypothetical protein